MGNSLFTVNRAKFLPQPRIGLAWSPSDKKTVIRAGFGMYNDLQDALGYRADQNAPFNPTYTIARWHRLQISACRLNPAAAPAATRFAAFPAAFSPICTRRRSIEYSVRVERQLSPNTSLSVGYVGSHGYHEIDRRGRQRALPGRMSGIALPRELPNTLVPAPGWHARARGNLLSIAHRHAQAEHRAGQYVDVVFRGQQHVQLAAGRSEPAVQRGPVAARRVHLVQRDGRWRFAQRDGGEQCGGAAVESLRIMADWGPATYDVRTSASSTPSMRCRSGSGKAFVSDLGGLDKLVSGWTVNTIVTLQSGFPFTPQLSYNPSNNGRHAQSRASVPQSAFTGPVVDGNPRQWFNPNAFIAPPKQRLLRQRGAGHLPGPGAGDMGFLRVQGDAHQRES